MLQIRGRQSRIIPNDQERKGLSTDAFIIFVNVVSAINDHLDLHSALFG
jgi:hypothetical protein